MFEGAEERRGNNFAEGFPFGNTAVVHGMAGFEDDGFELVDAGEEGIGPGNVKVPGKVTLDGVVGEEMKVKQ